MPIGFSPGCECCCDGCCLKSISFADLLPASWVAYGGAGYAVGDAITIAGGTACNPATLVVHEVAPGGVITRVTAAPYVPPATTGIYSAVPANPVAQDTTTGAGSGALFNLQWSSCCPCGAEDTSKGCSVFVLSLPGCGNNVILTSQGLDASGECVWSGTCDNGTAITLTYCASNHTWTLTAPGGPYTYSTGVAVCPPFAIGPATMNQPPSPVFQMSSSFNHQWWYCAGSDQGCIQNVDLTGTIALQPLSPTNAAAWYGSMTYEEPCNCFVFGKGCCGTGPACAGNCGGPPDGTHVTGNNGCLVASWSSFVVELEVYLTRSPIPCPCDPTCAVSWKVIINLLIGGILWCQLVGTASSTSTSGQEPSIPGSFTQDPANISTCWFCPQEIALDFSMFAFS